MNPLVCCSSFLLDSSKPVLLIKQLKYVSYYVRNLNKNVRFDKMLIVPRVSSKFDPAAFNLARFGNNNNNLIRHYSTSVSPTSINRPSSNNKDQISDSYGDYSDEHKTTSASSIKCVDNADQTEEEQAAEQDETAQNVSKHRQLLVVIDRFIENGKSSATSKPLTPESSTSYTTRLPPDPLTPDACAQMRAECLSALGGDARQQRIVDGRILKALSPGSNRTDADAAMGSQADADCWSGGGAPAAADDNGGGRVVVVVADDDRLRAALCYLQFLNDKGLFNPAAVLLAAEIFYKSIKRKLVNESFVLHFYDQVLEKKFADFMNIAPLARMHCLAPTSRWREAWKILRKSNQLRSSASCYYMMASCLIDHGLIDKAFDLLDAWSREDVMPSGEMFLFDKINEFHHSALHHIYGLACNASSRKESYDLFVDYVTLLRELKFSGIPFRFETLIKNIIYKFGPNWNIKQSQVLKNRCTSCSKLMEMEEITNEEFELMRTELFRNIIRGDDIFRQSSPAETKKFLKFVEDNKPFNVVVDVLNVGLGGSGRRMPPGERPVRILNLLKRFKEQRMMRNVCLIGRVHFFKYPKAREYLEQLRREANIFLLNDSTHDDPFTLYAALASGPHCYLISNDMFAFLTEKNATLDPRVRFLYLRWMRTRVMLSHFVEADNRFEVLFPPLFSIRCQYDRIQSHFHLPLLDQWQSGSMVKTSAAFTPASWLCISKK